MRLWPLAFVLVAGRAAAEPPPAPEPPAPPTGIDALARRPGAERGFVFDTAVTVPRGQVELGGRTLDGQVNAVDLAAGVTSTTQLDVEYGVIGNVETLATGVVQVVAHTDRFRIALDGTLRQLNQTEFLPVEMPVGAGGIGPLLAPGEQTRHDNLFGAGAVMTGCLDPRCEVELNAGGQALLPLTGGDVVGLGWGDVEMGNESVRLVVEVIGVGGDGGGSLALVGARGTWRHLGVEGGITVTSGGSPGVAPMVGLTVRP